MLAAVWMTVACLKTSEWTFFPQYTPPLSSGSGGSWWTPCRKVHFNGRFEEASEPINKDATRKRQFQFCPYASHYEALSSHTSLWWLFMPVYGGYSCQSAVATHASLRWLVMPACSGWSCQPAVAIHASLRWLVMPVCCSSQGNSSTILHSFMSTVL